VLRRLRRPTAVVVPLLLIPAPIPALTACGGGAHQRAGGSARGSASGSASADAALSAVSFTGDVGKSLTATWHSEVVAPEKASVRTLVRGTGEPIASGDSVSTYLWIGDGSTQRVAYSDYTNGAPESLSNNGQLGTVFDRLFSGATYGSRMVAVTRAADLLGSPSVGAQLGIDADDSLVVVADLVRKAPVSPKPTDDQVHDVPAGRLPALLRKNGEPTGLSWKGIIRPALATPVQRAILTKGTGAKVKATDTITVNYLGALYGANLPFDESYSKKPYTAALSDLIQGWTIGLTGVRVGSRVLLQIPPAYGYGAEGSGSTVPPDSTLWFVIDVVKAQATPAAP
jgi:peptidylprolyl isomerase